MGVSNILGGVLGGLGLINSNKAQSSASGAQQQAVQLAQQQLDMQRGLYDIMLPLYPAYVKHQLWQQQAGQDAMRQLIPYAMNRLSGGNRVTSTVPPNQSSSDWAKASVQKHAGGGSSGKGASMGGDSTAAISQDLFGQHPWLHSVKPENRDWYVQQIQGTPWLQGVPPGLAQRYLSGIPGSPAMMSGLGQYGYPTTGTQGNPWHAGVTPPYSQSDLLQRPPAPAQDTTGPPPEQGAPSEPAIQGAGPLGTPGGAYNTDYERMAAERIREGVERGWQQSMDDMLVNLGGRFGTPESAGSLLGGSATELASQRAQAQQAGLMNVFAQQQAVEQQRYADLANLIGGLSGIDLGVAAYTGQNANAASGQAINALQQQSGYYGNQANALYQGLGQLAQMFGGGAFGQQPQLNIPTLPSMPGAQPGGYAGWNPNTNIPLSL